MNPDRTLAPVLHRRHFTATLAGLMLATNFAVAPHAHAQEAPDALIRRVVGDVTAAINADPAIQSGERSRITALIEARVLPHLDLEAMTRTAAGRHWARATPEQQKALTTEFSRLLANTYAGAFASYRPDTRIDFRPARGTPADDEAVVRTQVTARGGEPMQLDYMLERRGAAWKVVDINVLGARLVETYKNQFNGVIASDGIEGLVKALATRNRAYMARPG